MYLNIYRNMEIKKNGRRSVTFSVLSELISEYSKLCEEQGLIASRRIERFIQSDIETIKEKRESPPTSHAVLRQAGESVSPTT